MSDATHTTSTSPPEREDLYSRQRVMTILGRVRRSGGIPLTEEKKSLLTSWFRTLAGRGFVSEDLLTDPERAKAKFKETVPNGSTRTNYTRSFLLYIDGLTDEEYQQEYKNIPRVELVKLINAMTSIAWQDRKAQKAAQQR